jgi:hypothetical protein
MNTYLSKGNKKYLIPGLRVRTFGLPAYKAKDGTLMCPGAGQCRKGCYACQGHYSMPNVTQAQERRLKLTRNPRFVDTVVDEVQRLKLDYVRIHDSGDFYSRKYLEAWIRICRRCPGTTFFGYTKMVPLVHAIPLPPNMCLALSEGGIWDQQIDRKHDLHARVFSTRKDLRAAGYLDVSKRDVEAVCHPTTHRLGLVYHGFKSRTFSTGRSS